MTCCGHLVHTYSVKYEVKYQSYTITLLSLAYCDGNQLEYYFLFCSVSRPLNEVDKLEEKRSKLECQLQEVNEELE